MATETEDRKLNTIMATVQLVAMNKKTMSPDGWGSGVLLMYNDGLYLFTALHNALLRVRCIQGIPVFMNCCPMMPDGSVAMKNHMAAGFRLIKDSRLREDANTGAPYLDISFTEAPSNNPYCRWEGNALVIDNCIDSIEGKPYGLRNFNVADLMKRSANVDALNKCHFSFYATVNPDDTNYRVFGAPVVSVSNLYIPDLTFRCLDGDHYINFETPKPVGQYHINFSGSSGAPILDDEGFPIALVCGGEDGEGNERVVRAIRLDSVLNGLSNFTGTCGGSLSCVDLESTLSANKTQIMSILRGMLDDDQWDFYWGEVDKGLIY